MKKFKKLIALTCVAAMLVPTLAFAADGEYTGDGVIENNNAPELGIQNVVLPTVNSDTYSFTIDAEELLAEVDSDNYNDEKATGVWFSKQSEPAKLTIVANTDPTTTYALKEQVKDVDTALATISTMLRTKLTETASTLADSDVADYYVWVPTTNLEGKPDGNGTFQQLTAATIGNYFTITRDETTGAFTNIVAKQHTTGNIFDGNLYVVAYEDIDAADAAAKYYVAGDSPSLNAGLYVVTTTSGSAGAPVAATLGANAGELTYTEAKFTNEGSSSEATIVNKSTFDIAVKVDVTVNDATGLTFAADAATCASDGADNASIYMAIKNGSNVKAVAGTAAQDGTYATAPSATAYYVIAGTGEGDDATTLYQTAGPEAVTGSHQYYKYLNPVDSYESAAFTIEAAVDAADDWDAYVEALKEAGAENATIAPDIKVVYTFTRVDKTTAESGLEYADAEGNTYTAASASDGWAAYKVAKTAFKSGEELTALKLNGARDKYYFSVTTAPTSYTATAYLLDSDNNYNPSNGINLKDSTPAIATQDTVIMFTIATMDSLLTAPGTYGIITTIDGVNYYSTYVVD